MFLDVLKYNGTKPIAPSRSSLSDDAYVGIGYSTITLLILLVASIVLPIIPPMLGSKSLRSKMPLARSNSMVISAACHVPILGSTKSLSRAQAKPGLDSRSSNTNEPTKGRTNTRRGSDQFEMQSLLSL